MGSDGSAAAAYVRRQGGEVWTQRADSCVCSSMPDSLREAGYSSFNASPANWPRHWSSIWPHAARRQESKHEPGRDRAGWHEPEHPSQPDPGQPHRAAPAAERPHPAVAQRRRGRTDRLSQPAGRRRRAAVVPGPGGLARPAPAAAVLRGGLQRRTAAGTRQQRAGGGHQRPRRTTPCEIPRPAGAGHSALGAAGRQSREHRRAASGAGTGGGGHRRRNRADSGPGRARRRSSPTPA